MASELEARYDGFEATIATGRQVAAIVAFPGAAAKALYAALARQYAEFPLEDSMPSRFADPEARALAAIVDRLAELEAETDGDAVRRVVRYLHRRYRDE